MDENDLKLTDLNLSKEQFIDLFTISLSAVSLAQHDLKNARTGLSMLLINVVKEFEKLSQEKPGTNRLAELLPDAVVVLKAAREKVSLVIESLDRYFDYYQTPQFDENFISKPTEIVEAIRKLHKSSDIAIGGDSPTSLAIIYPGKALFGILRELVENAEKHNTSERKILIHWRVEGGNFHCEVHDNGLGIAPMIGQSFYPLDAIFNSGALNVDAISGLSHIFKVIAYSKGLLLFSNSQILGGTLVYFKIPILGHNLK